MMHARGFSRYVLLAILVVVPGSLAPGAAPQQGSRLERVKRALDTLNQKVPGATKEINWLTTSAGETVPESMVKNLEGLVDALRRSENTATAKEILEEVRQDIAIKWAVCRLSPEGMAIQVPLIVRTWTSGEPRSESPRWNVHYLSAPLASSDLPGDSFPTFSSPTSISLPPGRYVVWAQDPDNPKRRGPRKDVTLGSPDGTIPAGGVKTDVVVAVK